MIDFTLNPSSGVPIYRQIQDQIRYGIASGLLTPGEQLPTVRELAVRLEVNPNTVIKAYTELERAGVLSTEQGSGTWQTLASASSRVRPTSSAVRPAGVAAPVRPAQGLHRPPCRICQKPPTGSCPRSAH